ncbi:MAG: SUMF1/EgtB/PvdO family nonheme iron enzyme, partial [Anaerolineales bacterium]|nr:SUMF1/EgtB/PvdO family nonheme iron enzyme [Anaerolineales bacterium]
MGIDILLSAALEAGLSLLLEAGFGDEARALKARLTKKDEAKRRAAIEKALQQAAQRSGEQALNPLLAHRPFQEEVVAALMDPSGGFDLQAASRDWAQRLPDHDLALRRFFRAFEHALMEDETLGPLLERYQNLRYRQDVQAALKERHLPANDRLLVPSLSAQLHGLGVIVQGSGNTVVGPGGLLVQGDYHQAVTLVLQQFVAQSSLPAETSDARRRYLQNLRRFCQSLPLAALGGEEDAEEEITLDSVYIDLDTRHWVKAEILEKLRQGQPLDWQEITEKGEAVQERGMPGRERDAVPLPLLEAVTVTPRAALLGDPGAGKSTFVRKLLAWQAAALLGECALPPGFLPELLPILINLRDLAPRLLAQKVQGLPAERQKQALLKALREQALAELEAYQAEAFGEALEGALADGKVLLVLDGLDETPESVRGLVRQVVLAALELWQPQRLLVTCRIRSYTGAAVLPLRAITAAPFDEEKIGNFASGWYRAQQALARITPQQAEERARDLTKAATSPDLAEIAGNPMMLTSMAIIHQKEIGLPKERVRLYKLVVDVLLLRWQKHKTGDDSLAAFLKDDLRLHATLERLAYEAQRARPENGQAGDLSRGDLLVLLEAPEYLGSLGLAEEFLDYVDQRAGLLVGQGGADERPASYAFPHRTFQEYLAGCYLAGQRSLRQAFLQHAAEGDLWDLAAQLAFEEIYFNRRGQNTLMDLIYALCPADCTPESDQQAQVERARLWAGQAAVLVGAAVIERDPQPGGGMPFLKRLRPGLVEVLGGVLSPLERAEAGRAVARLSDPRPEVMTVAAMPFCFVPAGPFLMGSQKDEPGAFGDERPQYEVALADFWIGKYPVSNAQFGEFVQAGGYGEARFWPEAIRAEIWREGKIHLAWADEVKDAATDFGEPFNLPNHPVVGVTWYEALAFTRWLGEKLAVGRAQFLEGPDLEEEQ